MVNGYPASIRRRASLPPILPTPIKPTRSSDIAQLLEDFFRQSEAVHGCRDAAIDANLQKHFFDLVFRDAVCERTPNVRLDFVWPIQCGEHGQIQKAARLLIQTRPAPDFPPAVLRDE